MTFSDRDLRNLPHLSGVDKRERTTVGSRLRALRLDRGYSQRDLAALCHMTNGSLSMIEQGKVSPSVSSLEKILSVYSMSLAEFFAQTTAPISPLIEEKDLIQLEEPGVKVTYFTFNAIVSKSAPELGIETVNMDAVAPSPQTGIMMRIQIEQDAKTAFAWLPKTGFVRGILLRGPVDIRVDGRSYHQSRGAFNFSLSRKVVLSNLSRVQSDLTAVYLSAGG